MLLAVVLGDLVPDIAHDVGDSGPGRWTAVVAGVASFAATGVALRWGCVCGSRAAGGAAAALAIGVHRALEGWTLAVTTSIPVVAALVVHAGSEGFALASLFSSEQPRRTAVWLLVACAGPAVGASALGAVRVPDQATPIVTAVVAGALARTAVAACRLAMADETARPRSAIRLPRRAIRSGPATAP